jgi:Asp-tRNA(Asn)/Glu-tRNA(Gln) amidotransferase B subunit
MLSITACSAGPSPTDVSKGFLGALKESNFEKAGSYVAKSDTSEIKAKIPENSEEKVSKLMLSKFAYEVGESTVDGDKATVKVKITSLDMVQIASNIMRDMIPLAFATSFSNSENKNMDNLMEQQMLNRMSDPNAPRATTETIINLTKTKEGWKIGQGNDELFNAITGNIMTAFGS